MCPPAYSQTLVRERADTRVRPYESKGNDYMRNKRINGVQFEKMLKNGLQNLNRHEEEVNKLNVFPVPDGDTGTNMYLTLANGIKYAKSSAAIGVYTKTLSAGMLLGARGNSGVILSQFFKGVYTELARSSFAGPGELRNALIRGYRTAYDSVIKPVEGTILTVAREGIEHIRGQITRNSTIEEILAMYIAEMKKTLSYTPEMLDVLKEAGVVDSGGQGFIYIFEGMLSYLYGDVYRTNKKVAAKEHSAPNPGKEIDFSLFNENSSFEDGYCMEFILQLLKGERYTQRFKLETYIEDISVYGNSLVVVQDGKRVKVHIHTLKPAKVIALSQEYGEFLTFKLENMQLQHNEVLKKKIEPKKLPHKELAIVSVVNGDGLETLFKEMGCDVVIKCEETMNASAQEFVSAFELIDADVIVVMPNNKNVILAAQQAVELSGKKNVNILPTKSVAEGYFTIAMDIPDEKPDFRINQMKSGLEDVCTLVETTATRDYTYHELTCRAGEDIVLLNGELVCVSENWCDGIIDGMKLVPEIEDKETCVVFCGDEVDEEQIDELTERVEEEFPLLDVEFIEGGQKHYRWIIGLC